MKSVLGIGALLLFSMVSFAAQANRIAGTIDSASTVTLSGNVPFQAQSQNDRGLVEASMPMNYIVLQTQPSAGQQKALNTLLAQQQDKKSPNYRKWLTPEQYAERFALSPSDMAKIAIWLQAQGFTSVQPARGRDWIAFSGTAGLAEATFHTEIHYYDVEGETHYANATGVSIPAALNGIVTSIRGLNDFRPKAMGMGRPRWTTGFFPNVLRADYTSGFGDFLAPDDIATIYNITPLYSSNINGQGMKLAIVGQSDVHMSDIANFRAGFNLPAINLTTVVVGSDPGFTGDEVEADLDLEWSGAVARNASIIFVTSTNAFNSLFDAIDNNRAPVISISFGACESLNAPLNAFETELQKMNSMGITMMASSGDTGAAGCDDFSPVSSASKGLAVNYPASSPEATGLGGTEFSGDVTNQNQYWNSSNNSNGESAISYIPEMAWNDSPQTGTGPNPSPSLEASGGGESSCGIASSPSCQGGSGFPKPSWQAGLGVPADSVRDVPDVAITSSPNHDGYILCTTDETSKTQSCPTGNAAGIANAVNEGAIFGGTSAAAPVFAGMVVLLNQFVGGSGLGNINPDLYELAQNPSNGVFHDVTTGSNLVPCKAGTLDCPTGLPMQFGYSAGTGYDQATGLGSVDAHALVSNFETSGTTTTLSSSANPENSSTPVTFTATVQKSGSSNPTGTVTFNDGSNPIGSPQNVNSSGIATLQISLAVGGHSITASYSGDKKNGPSDSVSLIQTITENGGTPLTSFTVTANQSSVTFGTPVTFNAAIAPPAATNTVTFLIDGTPAGFSTLSGGGATSPQFSLKVGSHSITGLYSGDSTYQSTPFGPPGVTQVISKAATNVSSPLLSIPSVNVKYNGFIMINAGVTPAGPTGTVSFSVDGTAVGNEPAGVAFAYNPSALPAGAHSIVATYQGDTNFSGSTSSASTLNVEDFQISAAPPNVTISAPGKSGSTTLTINPEGGFNQTLIYLCSGLPTLATCVFTPVSSTSETVTITTTASSGALRGPFGGSGVFYAMLLPGLVGVLMSFKDPKRARRTLGLIAFLAATMLSMPACGGGSSTGGGGNTTNGTPTGTSTVTITAQGSGATGLLSHPATITLNVQ